MVETKVKYKYTNEIFSINILRKYAYKMFRRYVHHQKVWEVLTESEPIDIFEINISFIYHRFSYSENKAAFTELTGSYDENVVGILMEGILALHKDSNIKYSLTEEVEKVFECIMDKMNDQYNLKYTAASQILASQPDLNADEKLQLSVRTKGTEIIGRLTCVLWVYCKGKNRVHWPLY